ncbi:MAG: threonylcarbamoyl-AMP synthase [Candidatus Lokiarchaeota archaeon]|nr:threonylcarbamoyl-AMP synthase [Candidatus Lokiarchaeota archaeon]
MDPGKDVAAQVAQAAAIIKGGGIVAFPTETVYGLGANTFDAAAVAKIFAAKERPADDPLIVHVSSVEMVAGLVAPGAVGATARALMGAFWPGPLTLVFKKSPRVPDVVTSGLGTVAVRMPSHPVARALIERSGVPIAAPSANLFERPSPTKASHVLADLDNRIDAVIDGGDADIGVESTIVDMSRGKPTLLRPGGVSLERIEATVGQVDVHVASIGKVHDGPIESPGMGARHYAPEAVIILVEGERERVLRRIPELASSAIKEGRRTAILSCTADIHVDGALSCRMGTNQEQIAQNLFSAFREMDELRVDLIVAECTTEAGLGRAIMNRLRKAAERIIKA